MSRLGDGRAAVPPRFGGAGRRRGNDDRPDPAGAGGEALVETLDAEGAEVRACEAPWWCSTAPARCARWWAGRSYAKSQFNRAVDAKRQPGSTFKPFVYLTAMEQLGLRPDTVRVDEPVSFGNWSPKNSHNSYKGAVTLKTRWPVHQHGRGAARL
jgi:penicillin-binding protein 1A